MPEFNYKVGRNDPCPCGSRKKYKLCHGHHNAPPAANIFQAAKRVKSLTGKGQCFAPECMHAECSKSPINAHTVSRSGSLGLIQRDGHVYSYDLTLEGIKKNNAALIPQLTGWRQASTFPGFCGYHDKRLFEPLEDMPFTGSKEQCFLIAYRALAKEVHAKLSSAKQNDLRIAYAGSSPSKRAHAVALNKGVALGLRDTKRHKNRYDKVLLNKAWNTVKGLLIEFEGVFPIQCTGGLFPDVDILGMPLQLIDWRATTPDTINMSSFAADGKSYFLLCWLPDSDRTCARFAAAFNLVQKEKLPAVTAAFILQRTENCHFSPDWYDQLPDEGKQWCLEQGLSNVISENCLPPIAHADVPWLSGVAVKSIKAL